jgi:hypothetical protein
VAGFESDEHQDATQVDRLDRAFDSFKLNAKGSLQGVAAGMMKSVPNTPVATNQYALFTVSYQRP